VDDDGVDDREVRVHDVDATVRQEHGKGGGYGTTIVVPSPLTVTPDLPSGAFDHGHIEQGF